MVIKNAEVFVRGEEFKRVNIEIKGQRISNLSDSMGDNQADDIDAEGLYAIPGLVDIHFHGAMGHDLCDGDMEGLREIARYEASQGILAICPATMTFTEEQLSGVMENAAEFAGSCHDDEMAELVGINMEGPFISKEKIGAQNPLYVHKPDVDMFRRLQERAGGLVKLLDIAPETEGAIEFICQLKDQVRISLAHTNAGYEKAMEAYEKGAKHLTHLYNAMPGLVHRNPGPIRAAAESGATAELICDGIHVHPAMVRLAFEMFKDRIILISDSMEATGLGNGMFWLGGQKVAVVDHKAVLVDDINTIAGSVTNLYDCLKNAIFKCNIPQEEAIRAASLNPAMAIGISEDYGKIDVGNYASILLVDRDFNIKKIIHRGKIIL